MRAIKISIWAIAFLVLFASYSPTPGQVEKPQSPTTPDAPHIYPGKEVEKKAWVKKKPEPKYTKDARKHRVEGTVVLRCVFASTGQVTNIHVISGLPDGLTERAIEAAQKIKFKPAMKDGHPVSMWMELQYNFNLY
jgi:TonB family protein